MGKTFSTGLLTNGIWQDSSNNIGIGAAPSGSYKFEVTGTGRFSSSVYSSGSLQVAPTTSTGMIGVGDNFGGNMNAGIYRGGLGVTTSGNYLNIGGYDGVVITTGAAALGSQTVRLTIASTGAATFSGQIISTSASDILAATSSNTSYKWINLANTGGNLVVGLNNSAGGATMTTSAYASYIFTRNATDLVLGTNEVPRLTLASTGAATFSGALTGTTADFETTSGTRYLQIRDAGTSTPSIRSVNNTIAQLRHIAIEANTISLRTGASSGLTVTEALAISATGAATFSSSVTATSGIINGTTDAFFDINRSASGNAGRVRFQTAGTDEFEIGLKGGVAGFHITKGDATELVTVLTSGNVGIGTSSPNYVTSGRTVLDVNGTSTALIALSVGGTPKSYFYFDGTDTQLYSSAVLGLYAGGSERMRITSGGDININMPNSTNRYLSWYSGNGAYQVAAVSSISDPSYNDAGYLIFSTAKTSSAGFTEKMRITPNGNVGIGTTSPDQKLTIQAAGTANGLISFKNLAGTTTNLIGQPNAAGDVISTSGTDDLCFRTQNGNMLFALSNIEFARFTPGGNLLLGTTTNAGYILEVNGTARATNLRATTDLYLDRTGVAPAIVLNQSSIRMVDAAGSSTVTLSSISGNFQVSGALKTAAPSGGTAQTFKVGSYVGGAPSATGYVQVEINGTVYKLLTST